MVQPVQELVQLVLVQPVQLEPEFLPEQVPVFLPVQLEFLPEQVQLVLVQQVPVVLLEFPVVL
ncbi:hypothetical protein [uncultured Dubosiella sp.]|uniref:hypothetical protein n=1 Tax=uncultured Dubosiella sp. TaxID=1937011 RepID=UPI002604906D|nr:hypothetical protein [uncultured Dubosiella sp.]